jgi:hypothetical protein
MIITIIWKGYTIETGHLSAWENTFDTATNVRAKENPTKLRQQKRDS